MAQLGQRTRETYRNYPDKKLGKGNTTTKNKQTVRITQTDTWNIGEIMERRRENTKRKENEVDEEPKSIKDTDRSKELEKRNKEEKIKMNRKEINKNIQEVEEKIEEGRKENERRKDDARTRAIFWNVAGVKGKDQEFWEFLEQFDVIGLTETWMENKEWEKWEKKMPKGWDWKCQGAKREEKKGRAKGGIITGVRWEMRTEEKESEYIDGVEERRVRIGKDEWRILTLYNRGGSKTKLKEIEEKLLIERTEEPIMVGGDFNARIGERGGERGWEINGEEETRGAMDKTKNKEGEEMLEWMEEKGWSVLNGNKEGDESGKWTYYKGENRSTIDYAVVNEQAWEQIIKFEVGERIESDHQPIIVEIKTRNRKNIEKQEDKAIETQDWTLQGIKKYIEEIEKTEWKESGVEDSWREIKKEIRSKVVKRKWKISNKPGKKPWWKKECREKKKEALKAWKKKINGEGSEESYKEKLREYKKVCDEKKKNT